MASYTVALRPAHLVFTKTITVQFQTFSFLTVAGHFFSGLAYTNLYFFLRRFLKDFSIFYFLPRPLQDLRLGLGPSFLIFRENMIEMLILFNFVVVGLDRAARASITTS